MLVRSSTPCSVVLSQLAFLFWRHQRVEIGKYMCWVRVLYNEKLTMLWKRRLGYVMRFVAKFNAIARLIVQIRALGTYLNLR